MAEPEPEFFKRAEVFLADATSDQKLQALCQLCQSMMGSEDDKALLRLKLENLITNLDRSQLSQAPPCVYLEDHDEKLRILTFIANTPFVQGPGQPPTRVDKLYITGYVWAAIWVAPLETMRKWKQTIDDNLPLGFNAMLAHLQGALPQLASYWRARNTGNASARPRRQTRPKQIALERDKARCVLVKSQDPEVAHIYPFASMSNAQKCSLTSIALQHIWGNEPIRRFCAQMRQQTVDVEQNMLCLNCLIHFWIDQFKVALEPISVSKDNCKLFVRFRHLRGSAMKKDDAENGGVDLDRDPRDVLKDLEVKSTGEPFDFGLVHFQAVQRIEDGHEFVIETDDPDNRPLPSFEFMQVSYRMSLMIRLSGGAEEYDEPHDESPPGTSAPASMDYQSDVGEPSFSAGN
ncbi:hypothetical protein LZ30DRAFT_785680 [Colletotrichum cereale]|nr:hypothetical protein LZ30DRAFT_785680 [Colletotrichum cereale]